jgi:hypothetical protein
MRGTSQSHLPPKRRFLAVPLLLAATACSVAAPQTSIDLVPTLDPEASDVDEPSPPSGLHSPSSGSVLVASADGFELRVAVVTPVVGPGGTVQITTTFHNGNGAPIDFSVPYCSQAAAISAAMTLPTKGEGETWTGIAQTFKDYVLTEAYGRGSDPPPTGPLRVDVLGTACQNERFEGVIQPGETITDTFSWAAEITSGVPALPGEIPFTVTVAYDQQNEPPSPQVDGAPAASWTRIYKELQVNGTLTVAGDPPDLRSEAEIVDALLGDEDFVGWLAEEPSTTWSNANLFIQTQDVAEGIVPEGPSWELDLFREVGVPRNWAIAFIDPFDAELISVSYCDIPCDR